jgi:hypothetical protein
LGVDTTLSVLGAVRVAGEAAEAVVGVGRAGKAESLSAESFSAAEEGSASLGWEAFVAAAMFKIPGVGRLSLTGASGLATLAAPWGGASAFPLSAAFSAAFRPAVEAALFCVVFTAAATTTGCGTFGVPKAGKSSSCNVFCDLVLAMSLESPLSTASALMFFFASGAEATVAFLALAGVGAVAGGLGGTTGSATGGV